MARYFPTTNSGGIVQVKNDSSILPKKQASESQNHCRVPHKNIIDRSRNFHIKNEPYYNIVIISSRFYDQKSRLEVKLYQKLISQGFKKGFW